MFSQEYEGAVTCHYDAASDTFTTVSFTLTQKQFEGVYRLHVLDVDAQQLIVNATEILLPEGALDVSVVWSQ